MEERWRWNVRGWAFWRSPGGIRTFRGNPSWRDPFQSRWSGCWPTAAPPASPCPVPSDRWTWINQEIHPIHTSVSFHSGRINRSVSLWCIPSATPLKYRTELLPFQQFAADDQRAVDEDAVRQKEVFHVGRIARTVLQQVSHQPLYRPLKRHQQSNNSISVCHSIVKIQKFKNSIFQFHHQPHFIAFVFVILARPRPRHLPSSRVTTRQSNPLALILTWLFRLLWPSLSTVSVLKQTNQSINIE